MPIDPAEEIEVVQEEQFEQKKYPEEVGVDFVWDDEFAKEENYKKRLTDFCNETKDSLNLDPAIVLKNMRDLKSLGTAVYEKLFPDRDLIYHGDKHTELTTAAGVEMHLASLKSLYQSSEQFRAAIKNDPALAQKLVSTNLAAYTFHERVEWWERDKDIGLVAEALLLVMKGLPKTDASEAVPGLEGMGINLEDVNLIVDMDEFNKFLPDSLEGAMSTKLVENSVFNLDPILKRQVLNDAGAVMRTSDWLQTLNTNYMAQKKVIGVSNVPIEMTWGPLALAIEFSDVRPNALPNDWLKNKPGEKIDIVWNNVGASDWIYKNRIKPNLDYAMKYMEDINPKAYRELLKRRVQLEQIVARDEARKIKAET